MAGLLSGLGDLGLDDLENVEIYEKPKANEEKEDNTPKIKEKDFLYEKSIECPVCGENFTCKIMKSGKARLIGTDPDLRPKHEGIDSVKYDVQLCNKCGYAALSRYFPNVTSGQTKLIRENISKRVHLNVYKDEIYTYPEAIERYKLALANAIVKRARSSEKAYICLKSAWLVRGYLEFLEEQNKEGKADDTELRGQLKAQEENYITNAYEGFAEARKSENFPMAGMDEITIDYLLAVLAMHLKKYDAASHLVASILTSPFANARMKDKTRDLKEQILTELRKR